MSKPISSIAIGGFLVGAIVLLSAALLTFGGGEVFKEKRQFVIFFDSSLNGLNVGAPVKIQGVQVGAVKEVVLQMDPKKAQLVKP
ncbi:MAG: MlaD family protein, partial [Gammaproteobacteria bacterium]